MDIAKKSVRSSLILFVGNFLFTVISAISIILIARLLGPAQYGIYTLALVIPGLLQLFIGFGVNTAVIRYSAYNISIGKPEEARRFTINAIAFLWLIGSAFTVLNFAVAGTLSRLLLQRPELTPYVQMMSLSLIGNAIFLSIASSTIGWNWMSLSSLSQVVQSILKLALSVLLILAGLGVSGALAGHISSLIAAGLIGTAILYIAKLRGPIGTGSFTSDVREMLKFGLPLYAGSLISGLATFYVTIILAAIASNTVFGFYQAALNFLTPITLVSTALVNALFPAFASLDGIGGNVRAAFRQAYKFVAFILTPVIFFLLSASGLLIPIFYGASFLGSVSYLQLLALAYLPIAFGYTVHPAFFNGFGRTRLTMLMNLSAAIILAVCAPLFSFLFHLGVEGLIYATFLSYLVAWIAGTVFAERYMGATMDFRANGAILFASAASFAGTMLVPKIAFSDELTLLVYALVFFGIYLTLAPLMRAVNEKDISTLELTFGELRVVGGLVAPVLRYERAIISLTSKKRSA